MDRFKTLFFALFVANIIANVVHSQGDYTKDDYYGDYDADYADYDYTYDSSDYDYTYYDYGENDTSVPCSTYTSTLQETLALVLSDQPSQAVVDMLNLQGEQGFVPIQPKKGECMKLPVDLLVVSPDDMTLENSLFYIHDQKTDAILSNADFLVGEWFEKLLDMYVQDWYIIKPTMTYQQEQLMSDQGKTRDPSQDNEWVFPMWPSVFTYVNVISMNVKLQADQDDNPVISLLYYTQSEESIRYLDILKTTLQQETRGVIRMGNLYRTRELMLQNQAELLASDDYRVQKKIRLKCTENVRRNLLGMEDLQGRTTIVVIFMDLPASDDYSTFTMLRALLHHTTGLDDLKLPWIIADIRFAYEAQYIPPYKGQEIQSTIYNPIVNMNLFPRYYQTMVQGMSEAGVIETGLRRAISLIEQRLANDTWSKTDFFRYCFPDNCSDTLEEPGFPTNIQAVTRRIYLESSADNCGGAGYQPCDVNAEAPMFTPAQLQTECESYDDETTNVHEVLGGDYKLCRHVPLKQLNRRPAYATLIQDPPFVVKKSDGSYDGFAVEIYRLVETELARLGIVLNLKFTDADSYGAKSADGKWTGVFGQLSTDIKEIKRQDKYVVLGLGMISNTKERSSDKRFAFSPACAYSYYTYMVNKDSYFNGYTQFTRPFHPNVWYSLLAVMAFSGIYIWIMQSWNPFKDDPDPDNPKFNGRQSFWHSFMVITQVGAPFETPMPATRVYSVFYWFFALIVVACYTGNLASFLSESEIRLTWKIGVPDYTYGVVANTSVASKIKEVILPGSPWANAVSNAVTVRNYSEGVKRVLEEKFVMIGSSLVLENYMHKHECQSYVWQGQFYEAITSWQMEAIAFPMRRKWRHSRPFRRMMRRLLESGRIQDLYNKWLKNKSCQQDDDDTKRLDINNFLGLYILLAVGILVSFILLAVKLLHLRLRDGPRKQRKSAKYETDAVEKASDEGSENVEAGVEMADDKDERDTKL